MFKVLPGFREFYPEDLSKLDYIFKVWRDKARVFGFSEFQPPILEQVELFTQKSGEEIKSQLFEFVDKGNRGVSLRPEMTPSLARMVGAKVSGMAKPIKWFCIGENYRYERQQKGRLRAFYQYNADILGETSIAADAEIITLLIDSLRGFGLTENEFRLRLGDRDLWVLFLKAQGLKEEFIMPMLACVDKIERVPENVFLEMLEKSLNGIEIDLNVLVANIKNFINLRSLEDLKAVFGNIDDEDLQNAIEARIQDWQNLIELLEAFGVKEYITIDLGIVRGLAYYTGFVFEAFQIVGKARALAGGGRYDYLTQKLGYQNIPAVGFGMGDVTVADLLALVDKVGFIDNSLDAYFIIAEPSLRKKALNIISKLRDDGIKLSYNFKDISLAKQFKTADSLKAKYAIILGSSEYEKSSVKIKNLKDGDEYFVNFDDLSAKTFTSE